MPHFPELGIRNLRSFAVFAARDDRRRHGFASSDFIGVSGFARLMWPAIVSAGSPLTSNRTRFASGKFVMTVCTTE